MLIASVVGSASTPGEQLHQQSSKSPSPPTQPWSLFGNNASASSSKLKRSIHSYRPDDHDSWGQDASRSIRGERDEEADRNFDDGFEEEVAWWDNRVVYSRSNQVVRQWTFEDTDQYVTWAGFVWFQNPAASLSLGGSGAGPSSDGGSSSVDRSTFGPFHTSMSASWGSPDLQRSDQLCDASTSLGPMIRTMVICLVNLAHVYYPSGEDITFHLPFTVEKAFPLPANSLPPSVTQKGSQDHGMGGLLIQRKLEKRELRRLNASNRPTSSFLKGMENGVGSTSILDEVVDLDEDEDNPLPRLYTLTDPFEELRPVVRATLGPGEGEGVIVEGSEEAFEQTSSVLFSSDHPYPFVLVHDQDSGNVTFYKRVFAPMIPAQNPTSQHRTPNGHLPTSSSLSAVPAAKPTTSIPPSTSSSGTTVQSPAVPASRVLSARPSLHRNPSTFSTTSERRVSGAADPLDRTRRGPRISRSGLVDPHPPPSSTDDLQAALEPPSLPPATVPSAPNGSRLTTKGKARSSIGGPGGSAINGDPMRRLSGAGTGSMSDVTHHMGGLTGLTKADSSLRGMRLPALHEAHERDLRETTMLMGLDKEEEGNRSDIVLEEIWTWRPDIPIVPSEAKVFLTDNIFPDQVNINITLPLHLYVFAATRSGPDWTIKPFLDAGCTSAVPVICTRPGVSDTLVMIDGEMQLLTSSKSYIPITLVKSVDKSDELPHRLETSLSMVLDDPMNRTKGAQGVVELLSSVNTHCRVVLQDGGRVRIELDHRVKDPLVRRCMEALCYVLPRPTFTDLKIKLAAELQRPLVVVQWKPVDPWATFTSVFGDVLGLSSQPPLGRPIGRGDLVKDLSETSLDPVARKLAERIKQKRRAAASTIQKNAIHSAQTSKPALTASALVALHLVAQDLRLSQRQCQDLGKVGTFLLEMAFALGNIAWFDYWKRLVPDSSLRNTPSPRADPIATLLDKYESPPDILAYLSRRLIAPLFPFPTPQSLIKAYTTELGHSRPCSRSTLVISIYDHLGPSSQHSSSSQDKAAAIATRAASMLEHMVQCRVSKDFLPDLPPGAAMPILEMLRICQFAPGRDWDARAYHLIGRTDLAAQADGKVRIARNRVKEPSEDIPTVGKIISSAIEPSEATDSTINLTHVRFASDRRLAEVERIMQTTRVRTISVQEPKGSNEAELVQHQQSMVNTISNRTLSIPAGQGIFEFGTRHAIITDTWEIPLIELAIKVLPAKTTLHAQIAPENADWPRFHNGVAAALSISPECKGIDSSWIVFNRPQVLNPEHGGFLLGLGLTGHLRKLMTYHAFPYMEPRHDQTSAGLLLGLGCSFAGSADLLVTKVLSLHTHALLPLGSMELNASPIIQSSAMVGLGLVYAGSKNLRMAEVTLGEMGRKEMPGVEGFQDHQETYTFSAAMSFGLIMLGRGGQATSEVDRRLLAQLRRCIIGSGPSMDSGHHSAPSIDTSISAPGATVALGFMYLKTGRRDVADMLEIPQSAFALEHVRPDLLLLRTLSRALIMFDDISPTLGWIEGLIPDFIAHKGHKRTSQLELNVELAYFNIVAGACLAIGLKYAGTATEMAHNNLMFFFSILSKAASGQSMAYEGKIRRAAARQALNVVTIAWTVVMSGTGELNVLRRLRVVHGQEGAGVNYGTHMATHMACGLLFLGRGHYTLGSSNLAIAAMTIAFFPRFSATPGDNKSYPQTFRHLWALAVEPRCLVSRDVDTLETVFLPVKIKSEENGQIRHQSLISPTLIAPFENVLSIEVDSPRYWSIVYDLSNPKHKEALVRTRTIYVKRKLGFLDYNNDPKGNRSIFVRAGSVYGFDLHYDLISPASPPTISADEVVGLITAHSGDPTLISLAKVFSGDSDLERGLRVVLLECVSLDKPAVVGVYLTLLLGLQARGWAKVELVNQLGMLKLFYSPAVFDKEYLSPLTGGERRVPLIRQNTLSALWRRLTLVEEVHSGSETSLVTRVLPGYVDRGEWPVLEIEWPAAERLAIYLAASNTPPWQLLALLKAKYQSEATAANAPVMISRLREVAKRYTEAIEGQWDVDGRSRETTALWSENSMSRVAAAWTLDG